MSIPEDFVGWADVRLGQAYDLIDAVLAERATPESELYRPLRHALNAVEAADCEIETALRAASGIEAATADETRSGSAEGESPAPEQSEGETPNA